MVSTVETEKQPLQRAGFIKASSEGYFSLWDRQEESIYSQKEQAGFPTPWLYRCCISESPAKAALGQHTAGNTSTVLLGKYQLWDVLWLKATKEISCILAIDQLSKFSIPEAFQEDLDESKTKSPQSS